MANKPIEKPNMQNVTSIQSASEAPAQGAFFMHLDDFLNTIHNEIYNKTGHSHIESLTAFAKMKQKLGHIKLVEEQWRKDLEAWLNEEPK